MTFVQPAQLQEQKQRGDVSMKSKATVEARKNRRTLFVRQTDTFEEVRGKRISQMYKAFMGISDEDEEFAPAAYASNKEVEVEVKKFPFGVVRYQPGKNWKGAMVKDVEKPFFSSDPNGRAFEAGVKPGMVIKKINGQDVLMKDFDSILESLGDERYRNYKGWTLERTKKKLPLKITFAAAAGER
eukprot:CAMPEP_0172685112 /NCGR_PEP_ID=MMETSP1074-20121228/20017_1 /TAXON_ID=2916 /ORGANISM="Ceratium fusus, Strain PA161109" /LENGTH=184 /DNA_ID=CAMNT_0013504207 /DNA_START=180 /DNA_END=734 /DNA_ORIENTATION=-